MNEDELWLYTFLQKNKLQTTEHQIRRLSIFKTLLLEWNKKINLVSRKNEEALWKSHISFSLTMLFKINFPNGTKILDLGTGGGFPGIPLSVMLFDCSFLLLDSTQKKITAVQSMIDEMELNNVQTIWGRAEDLQRKENLNGSFDFVVARSVSNISNLVEWGIPFLKQSLYKKTSDEPGNERITLAHPALITFKGGEIDDELIAVKNKFQKIDLQIIPLIFSGSEEFENQDKKIIVASIKK
jgi:16S rRNA (guanine527-N7)-methyltransferase